MPPGDNRLARLLNSSSKVVDVAGGGARSRLAPSAQQVLLGTSRTTLFGNAAAPHAGGAVHLRVTTGRAWPDECLLANLYSSASTRDPYRMLAA